MADLKPLATIRRPRRTHKPFDIRPQMSFFSRPRMSEATTTTDLPSTTACQMEALQPNFLNRLLVAFNAARKSLLLLGGAILCTTAGFYLAAPAMLGIIQAAFHQRLAFFTVAEPFLAHVKLAFFGALFILMPAILLFLWRTIGKPFGLRNGAINWFVLATCLLFYAGAGFCYFITLPFGINFLLGYQTTQLKPLISVDRFVTFVALFILAFGLVFELPVIMVFTAWTGLCRRQLFEQYRRYAVLAISILAAVLTPTPDVMNMMLMGVPLYLLYELGILLLRILRI